MRGHAAWYVKGLPRSHKLKLALTMITTMAELDQLLTEYEKTTFGDGFELAR